MGWAVSLVNPNVRVALAVIGLLPTPPQRTAALLDLMRSEVHRRSGKEHTMADTTVCLSATELFNLDPLASVDTVVWRCRLCDVEGSAKYRPAAHTDAVEHLVDQHRATIGTTP